MTNGLYTSRGCHKAAFYDYSVTVKVKDDNDSTSLELIEFNGDVGYLIERMFNECKKVTIKNGCYNEHQLQKWENDTFTLFPYKRYVPYVFYLREEA